MARSRKFTETTISQALNATLEQTIEEAALTLGIDPFRLQELFVERLGIEEPMTWLTVPFQHEALFGEIKRGLESEASVRRFDIPAEPIAELSAKQEPEELPIIQDEPQPKRSKGGKLTQKRTGAIQETLQDTVTLEDGIQTTELDIAASEGIQDGGQLATTYLAAKQVTENKIRKDAAKRRVAKTLQKTAKQKDFSPLEVLQRHGLNPTSDDLEELQALATPVMGMVGNASSEILTNSWMNGLSLDLTELNDLLSDSWSD